MNEEIIHVKTASGFEADIRTDALDDFELIEDLARIDKGDLLAVSSALSRLLGEEQKKKLLEFCRDPKTKISSFTRVSSVLMELFTSEDLKK